MTMRLRWWVLISALLAGASLAAEYYLVTWIWPDPRNVLAAPQLLFLLFMFVGLTAGAVPITAYLNYRFAKPGWLQRDRLRLLRQGLWIGLLGITLAYLQLTRALNVTIAVVLTAAFFFVELFFLTRE